MTRRQLAALVVAGAVERPAAAATIQDLGLPPELLAELEQAAAPVLKQAAWLADLSLDGVPYAFAFTPR